MAAEKNQDATSIPLEALKRVATDSAVAYVVEGVLLFMSANPEIIEGER